MNLSASFDTSQVINNMRTLLNKAKSNCLKIMEYTVTDAEGYAKQNAPWHDRTGNARKSITHKSASTSIGVIGAIGIGVFYGKYLELCNQGRYRIIRPTIDVYRYKLLQNMKGVLS